MAASRLEPQSPYIICREDPALSPEKCLTCQERPRRLRVKERQLQTFESCCNTCQKSHGTKHGAGCEANWKSTLTQKPRTIMSSHYDEVCCKPRLRFWPAKVLKEVTDQTQTHPGAEPKLLRYSLDIQGDNARWRVGRDFQSNIVCNGEPAIGETYQVACIQSNWYRAKVMDKDDSRGTWTRTTVVAQEVSLAEYNTFLVLEEHKDGSSCCPSPFSAPSQLGAHSRFSSPSPALRSPAGWATDMDSDEYGPEVNAQYSCQISSEQCQRLLAALQSLESSHQDRNEDQRWSAMTPSPMLSPVYRGGEPSPLSSGNSFITDYPADNNTVHSAKGSKCKGKCANCPMTIQASIDKARTLPTNDKAPRPTQWRTNAQGQRVSYMKCDHCQQYTREHKTSGRSHWRPCPCRGLSHA